MEKHAQLVKAACRAIGYGSVDDLSVLVSALLDSREKLAPSDAERFASITIKSKNMAITIRRPTLSDLIGIYVKSLT